MMHALEAVCIIKEVNKPQVTAFGTTCDVGVPDEFY